MQYSRKIEREISENGIEFDVGSVYARLGKITDVRKAKGKRYSLITILTIVLMAKLCGEDKPMGIADWAKNRQAELIKLLGLKRQSLPNHNTYRRILAYTPGQSHLNWVKSEVKLANPIGGSHAQEALGSNRGAF